MTNDQDQRRAMVLEARTVALRMALACMTLVDDLDPTSLTALQTVRDDARDLELKMIYLMREVNPAPTWSNIADALGVSRQSAHRRLYRRSLNQADLVSKATENTQYWQAVGTIIARYADMIAEKIQSISDDAANVVVSARHARSLS